MRVLPGMPVATRQVTTGPHRSITHEEPSNELGSDSGQLEAVHRQDQGAMGRAHRRSDRPDRRQARPAVRQAAGIVWHHQGRGRTADPHVRRHPRRHARRQRAPLTEEEPIMSKLLISLLAAAGIAFAGAANAAGSSAMSRDTYKADKDKIEAQYK